MMRLALLGPPLLLAAMVVATARPAPPVLDPGSMLPGSLLDPLPGAVVTQAFGCTGLELEPVAPQCPGGHFHSGLDLAAPAGTPVLATAAGVATTAYDPAGYGLHVSLSHGASASSLYGHLSALAVANGDMVPAGRPLGAVGSTGLSTGPHLHFEVRRDGHPVDPAPLIRRR